MMEVKKGGSKRLPTGRRQLLCILDEDVVERIKIAAIRSNARVSHVVQYALKEWLARQEATDKEAGPLTSSVAEREV